MTRILAVLVLLLSLGAAPSAKYRDPYGLERVAASFMFDGVNTTWTWADCGQINAYYFPGKQEVVMCNELRKLEPGVIRYIFAHELSHGVIMQLRIPYTGSHEATADELAALMLVVTGRDADVLAAARWWLTMGRDENPYDDHPGDVRRAHNLLCMVLTYADHTAGCNTRFERVAAAWVRLLGIG
jgi:hypothetical protein